MKRLITLVSLLWLSQPLCALPLMNPADASLYTNSLFFSPRSCCDACIPWYCDWQIRGGFYEDYVSNRKLQVDGQNNSVIHQTTLRTDAALLALNLCEFFDIFATLGRTRSEIIANRNNWESPIESGNQYTYLLPFASLSWSLGGRLTIWECGCFALGAEGQYFQTNTRLRYFWAEGIVVSTPDGPFKYQEWQAGLGGSYKINVLSPSSYVVPYAGIKWSNVHTTTNDTVNVNGGEDVFFDLKSHRHYGYAVGLTFIWSSLVSVSVEARFLDERAYHFNAQIAF